MSPEDLGRIVHAEHARGAAAKIEAGAYVPPAWDLLRQDERDCYIAQAEAVRAVLVRPIRERRLTPISFPGEFDFDDTGHAPCQHAPYATCTEDFDEPPAEPTPALIALMRGDIAGDEDEPSAFAYALNESWASSPTVAASDRSCNAIFFDRPASSPLALLRGAFGLPLHMIRNPDGYVSCERMTAGPCVGAILP